MKTRKKTDSIIRPILPTLYGFEHDGIMIPPLCTAEFLDHTTGGFEFKADVHYNPWPTPRRDPHHWVMVERGLHKTVDISDIETLLNSLDTDVIISDRCVTKLVSLGYEVVLQRSRTIVTKNIVKTTVTHYPGRAVSEFIASDVFQTHKSGIGKWKK